jgi:hypothetical protein
VAQVVNAIVTPSEGAFLLPHWDAQNYLISIASEVPDVVLAHFERIRTTKNYLRGAVMALCLIPTEQAESVVSKLLGRSKKFDGRF